MRYSLRPEYFRTGRLLRTQARCVFQRAVQFFDRGIGRLSRLELDLDVQLRIVWVPQPNNRAVGADQARIAILHSQKTGFFTVPNPLQFPAVPQEPEGS